MSAKPRILVIDDDPIVRRSCERILAPAHDVCLAETGRQGLRLLLSDPFHVALVDLKLPDIAGTDILAEAPDHFPDVPVIIITGYSTIKSAVETIKMGAFDYLAKPFTPDELLAAVEKALRQRRLLTEYRALQIAAEGSFRLSSVCAESPPMRQVILRVRQAAPTDTTVLITGESGTGKELIARALHFLGPRKDARFVAVDCGAIAPGLIASELFGHVAGAFTGATTASPGLIQTAHGGTLFLDEISNLPLDLQATLLRAIEERQVRPVGAAEPLPVNIRLVAATNRDLGALVAEGKFRADLYYRLNVLPIAIPPLRERKVDIPHLARHFLARHAAKSHKRIDDFTPEALNLLMAHDWPGNVRELSNVVERIVVQCTQGRIGQAHVRDTIPAPAPEPPVPTTAAELYQRKDDLHGQAVAETERAFLLAALRRSHFNASRAAADVGMQRTHFQALLRKHGLRIRDLAAGHDLS
ncbi:MAG TPA: sigma-54 dependent transcriptional regulator [Planctomycetota bacterium]|nr:sigma-54 dependent transcriptional regulator [Planctomycetota bacterium]